MLEAYQKSVRTWLIMMKSHLWNAENRSQVILFIAGSICALWIRAGFIGFESIDYKDNLLQWYGFLKNHGGFPALKDIQTDYPPIYMMAMAVMTYLPIAPLYAIKGFSVLFDFFTAMAVYGLVRHRNPNDSFLPVLGFTAVLFWPTAVLNNSLWAQCDSIYTGWVMVTLLLLLRRKNTLAMIAYGIALAFKLQAVFILPLLGILWLKKEISLRQGSVAVLVFFAAGVPTLLLGKSLAGTYLYMLNHANRFQDLTKNALTLYQWVPNPYYAIFAQTGVVWAVMVVMALCLVAVRYGRTITGENLVELSWMFALLVPFLLPKMHERYFYLAEMMGIVYALYFPSRFYLAVILGLLSYFSYTPFLFGSTIIELKYLSVGMAAVVLTAVGLWLRRLRADVASAA
jgi:Gpi18-like mannosyltransferase